MRLVIGVVLRAIEAKRSCDLFLELSNASGQKRYKEKTSGRTACLHDNSVLEQDGTVQLGEEDRGSRGRSALVVVILAAIRRCVLFPVRGGCRRFGLLRMHARMYWSLQHRFMYWSTSSMWWQ